MVHSDLKDLNEELTKLIADRNHNNGRVYWTVFLDARVSFYVDGKYMNIRLPLPKIVNYGFASKYNMKKHNENEVERARNIWIEFIKILKDKLDKVRTGASTVEAEFSEGILLGDGQYGLKYEESWMW